MFSIIYLIGAIIAYILTRWANRKYCNCNKNPCNDKFCDRHYRWSLVFRNIIVGLLSWIGVVIFIFVRIIEYIEDKEPPKFL